jgi:SAM-dependent methyltransferase
VRGDTVLDIGGGVGAIQHLLLEEGAASTVDVDVSAAYASAAREEGGRRGNEERMSFLVGDAVALAPTLPTAGVVTLDRVICCYPDMPRLVEASTGRASRLYGVVYPRSSSPFRLAGRLANLFLRLRGSDFRVHIHPTESVDEEIRKRGFVPVYASAGLVWQVFLYARRTA